MSTPRGKVPGMNGGNRLGHDTRWLKHVQFWHSHAAHVIGHIALVTCVVMSIMAAVAFIGLVAWGIHKWRSPEARADRAVSRAHRDWVERRRLDYDRALAHRWELERIAGKRVMEDEADAIWPRRGYHGH